MLSLCLGAVKKVFVIKAADEMECDVNNTRVSWEKLEEEHLGGGNEKGSCHWFNNKKSGKT